MATPQPVKMSAVGPWWPWLSISLPLAPDQSFQWGAGIVDTLAESRDWSGPTLALALRFLQVFSFLCL